MGLAQQRLEHLAWALEKETLPSAQAEVSLSAHLCSCERAS